jgi:drug/metabolite transporter (DMT)-like permease
MTQNQAIPRTVKTFATSLLISLALVVPFAVLEIVNRRAFQEEFPFVLFTFMSVHSLLIALLMMPALQCLRADKSLRALKPGHWAGLFLAIILVYGYATVVIDQLPCFLGVPNCD